MALETPLPYRYRIISELIEARSQIASLQYSLREKQAELDTWRDHSRDWVARAEKAEVSLRAVEAELSAVSAAIGSVRFMDPPDGGDVSLAEQVSRMRVALEAADAREKQVRAETIEACAATAHDALAEATCFAQDAATMVQSRIRALASKEGGK